MPPNNITNEKLFEEGVSNFNNKNLKKNLRLNKDYIVVSEEIWKFFNKNYEGKISIFMQNEEESKLNSKEIYKENIKISLIVNKDEDFDKEFNNSEGKITNKLCNKESIEEKNEEILLDNTQIKKISDSFDNTSFKSDKFLNIKNIGIKNSNSEENCKIKQFHEENSYSITKLDPKNLNTVLKDMNFDNITSEEKDNKNIKIINKNQINFVLKTTKKKNFIDESIDNQDKKENPYYYQVNSDKDVILFEEKDIFD